jgi:hypothetical protein
MEAKDIGAADESSELLEMVRGKLSRIYRRERTRNHPTEDRRFYDTIGTVSQHIGTAAELLRRAARQAETDE